MLAQDRLKRRAANVIDDCEISTKGMTREDDGRCRDTQVRKATVGGGKQMKARRGGERMPLR